MAIRGKIKGKFLAVALFLCAAFAAVSAQEASSEIKGDPVKGQELFKSKCSACHKLDSKYIGPALGGVVARLKEEQGLGREWFQKWISNNEELRASGDKYANEVYEEYNQVPMTVFSELTPEDIDNVLAYTTNPPAEKEKVAPKEPVKVVEPIIPVGAIIVSFAVLFALLLWVLVRLNTLVKLSRVAELEPSEEERVRSVNDLFSKYGKLAYAVVGVLALLALYGLWNFLIGVGVDKGYQPEQPIYFSHKIHAGEQGIDCQYCHSSAKYGKVSGIPSTNVCMNCHYSIQEYNGEYVEEGKSKEFYTNEMQKIYAAIGFDKSTLEYTGEQNPIEWKRIHNMPDFVHFNHAQHVVAGEKAIKESKNVEQVCYACHGQVNEMDEVYMANDFTMGWCIECHRTTEVDMTNEYNKEYYARLHDKLVEQYGKGTTITVDAIGGIECGKCHY